MAHDVLDPSLAERLIPYAWPTYLKTQPPMDQLLGWLEAESPLTELALQAVCARLAPGELFDLIEEDGDRYPDSVCSALAQQTIDHADQLTLDQLIDIVEDWDSHLVHPAAWQRVMEEFGSRAQANPAAIDSFDLIRIAQLAINSSGSHETQTQLLTALARHPDRAEDEAAIQQMLLEHGTEAEQAAVWEQIERSADPERSREWGDLLRWVLRHVPRFAAEAWALLKETPAVSWVIKDAGELPEFLQGEYRPTLIRHASFLDLLEYYEIWPEERPAILQAFAAREWVATEHQVTVCQRASRRFPRLRSVIIPAQANGALLANFPSLPEAVRAYIQTQGMVAARLARGSEWLSRDELVRLFAAFPSESATMTEAILSRRDAVGLNLQLALLEATELERDHGVVVAAIAATLANDIDVGCLETTSLKGLLALPAVAERVRRGVLDQEWNDRDPKDYLDALLLVYPSVSADEQADIERRLTSDPPLVSAFLSRCFEDW